MTGREPLGGETRDTYKWRVTIVGCELAPGLSANWRLSRNGLEEVCRISTGKSASVELFRMQGSVRCIQTFLAVQKSGCRKCEDP
jgi:hypothetical protein